MKNSSIKILVLDDEPFMLKMLTRMLKNLGCTDIASCESGHVALEMLEREHDYPDLILLDLNMPDMDGIEFIRHLVEHRYKGSLILVSGEDERMQQAAEKLAITSKVVVLGHLHKPAKPEGLAELIEKWVPAIQEKPRIEKKIYSVDALRAAISNGELVNYYQPKVATKSGQVVGVETLVRWMHPQDGIVYPDQFIRLAEEHNLIDDLTLAVLTAALADTRIWMDAGLNLIVAVNLSMDNLSSSGYTDVVAGLALKAGVPPQAMKLEVTESRLMSNLSMPLEILTRLRMKRFLLSIDDFGTGNSSLAQLRDFPFDELKIDQSFVHGAWNNEKLQVMFDHSLELAKKLKMLSVAEGVEDKEDWDFVCSRGCDVVQGYYVAKAMPAAELPAWIVSWDARFKHLNVDV